MMVIVEPICHDSEHVPVNTSILETIRCAYPDEKINFYGESRHVDNIRDVIDKNAGARIIWAKIKIPERHLPFSKRISLDFKIIYKLINEIKYKEKNIKLLFTAANPSIIWVLKILQPFKLKSCRIQIILHGGLASINGWRSRNPFIRIQDQLSALSHFNWENIQYIVLEKSIRDWLLNSVPKLIGSVRVLDHPYPLSQSSENHLKFKNPIKFGYLGVAVKRKGFSQFLSTAREIKKKFPVEVEFHAIGRLHGEYRGSNLPELEILNTKPSENRLNRKEFIDKLNSIHFVCFFFDEKYYRYSASGVLLDAIAFEKPIICSKLKIFEDLDHEFGDIGYLCDAKGYAETIQKIIECGDYRKYSKQISNLRKLKNTRSPQGLSSTYRNLTEEMNSALKLT